MKVKRWLKNSAYTIRLPVGCRHCSRGAKLVLLVTGRCNMHCFYCPLSPEKTGRDVIYADELKVRKDSDVIAEAELIRATGTGITGGDPLLRSNRVAGLIRLLRGNFGERHHVHLYTSHTGIKAITAVSEAGLNEIRFHPPLASWDKLSGSRYDKAILLSRDLGMDVGLEVPVIPGLEDQTKKLLQFANDKELSFVNLNELEFSESNWRALRKKGFDVRDEISSGVKGSERLALHLLSTSPAGLPTHYCSSAFKDGVQLRRRIMRRARKIGRPLDIITEDGTIIMGIIETENADQLVLEIRKKFQVPKNLIAPNYSLKRIEIAPWVLREIVDELNEDCFIIEEYPTADRLEVEREAINIRRR